MQKGISSIDTVELKSADNFISALKSPFLPHEMSNYLKRLNITGTILARFTINLWKKSALATSAGNVDSVFVFFLAIECQQKLPENAARNRISDGTKIKLMKRCA